MKQLTSDLIVIDIAAPVGGYVDSVNPSLLADSEATIARNVNFDFGGIRKRYGIKSIANTGGTPFPAGDYKGQLVYQYISRLDVGTLLRVGLTHLYKWNGTNWVGVVSGLVTADATDVIVTGDYNCTAAQYNDYLFVANGKGGAYKYWNGASSILLWGWQGGVPPTGTNGAASVGGSLTDGGVYSWMYTYYNPTTGHESNPSVTSANFTATTPNLTQAIVVPANASWAAAQGYTTVRIYRTTADGATYLYEKELTGIANLATTAQNTTIGAVSDLTLSDEAEVEDDNDPPATNGSAGLTAIVLHDERLVGFGSLNPSTLAWSKASNPYSWPTRNAIEVAKDDGSKLRGILSMGGELYIMKHQGVWRVPRNYGDTGVAFDQPVLLTKSWGCLSHYSIIEDNGIAYWCDAKGIVRFDGQNFENLSDAKIGPYWRTVMYSINNISGELVPPLFQGVLERQGARHLLRWIIPDPALAGYTQFLCFDVEHKSWFFEDMVDPAAPTVGGTFRGMCAGRTASNEYWILSIDAGGNFFRHGSSNDALPLILYADGLTQAATRNYTFSWRSKWFGNGIDVIGARFLEFEMWQSFLGKTSGNLVVSLYVDGIETAYESHNVALYDSSTSTRTWKPTLLNLKMPRCHRFAFGFTHAVADGEVRITHPRVLLKFIGTSNSRVS